MVGIQNQNTVEFLKGYFCKNSCDVKGRDKLINKFSKTKNDSDPAGRHSPIVELEAFYLLQNKLGLPVSEYEPVIGNGKKPDFLIRLDNNNVTFEVKDKCSEEVRIEITREIQKMLDTIESGRGHQYQIDILAPFSVSDKKGDFRAFKSRDFLEKKTRNRN